MTAALSYTRFELLRAFRNRRFFFFSLGFPLVLYLLIAGPNGGEDDLGGSGIPARLYFMVGLAAFGTMNGVVAAGARIAAERSVGWTRQLRITPLRPSAYIATKLVTAYAFALLTLAVLYAAGIALGVHMPLREWIEMTALLLLGLLPFAALGDRARAPADGRVARPRDRRHDGAAGVPRRRLVPARRRLHGRRRPCPAVLLARPGRPHRDRRRGLERDRLGRDGGLDASG